MTLDRSPLVGDYDANGFSDIFWYGPGVDASDEVWWGTDGGNFEVEDDSVRGFYRPAIGDFNGDDADDVLWYAPGDEDDQKERVWWGTPGKRTFDSTGIYERQVSGSYVPVVGDFDGDCCMDILWLGSAEDGEDPTDVVWLGGSDLTFSDESTWGKTPQLMPGYAPLVGNFDGDCCDDVFFLGPGRRADVQWWGSGNDGFVRIAGPALNAGQRLSDTAPVTGNFIGRGNRAEILWVRRPN
jgi:hypothetical protein